MSKGNRYIYNKLFLFTIITIILISLYIVIQTRESKNPDIKDNVSEPTQAKDDMIPANFTLVDNFKYPFNSQENYSCYSIVNPNYSTNTANRTITRIFGDQVLNNTERFDNYEVNAYDYWVSTGVYGIRSDGMIFYFNHAEKELYSIEDIESNASLYNATSCQQYSIDYLKSHLGEDGFNDFKLIDNRTSTVMTHEGTYIKSYKFTYTRLVNNVTVWSNAAGSIHLSISPSGDVLSFMLYYPDLVNTKPSKPIDPVDAVSLTDENFGDYKPYLYAGYDQFDLVDINISYGLVDDELKIGWALSFSPSNNRDLTSDVFIYKE